MKMVVLQLPKFHDRLWDQVRASKLQVPQVSRSGLHALWHLRGQATTLLFFESIFEDAILESLFPKEDDPALKTGSSAGTQGTS